MVAGVMAREGVVGKGEYDVYGGSNGLGKCGAGWRGRVGTVEYGCDGGRGLGRSSR